MKPDETGRRRYLSQAEKRRIGAGWRTSRVLPYSDRPGDPDPSIFDLTDALNALPGLATLQSCSGHIRKFGIEPGRLWLKLSKAVAGRFYLAAPILVQHELIERVSILWGTGEGEVVDVIFAGNERDSYAESAAVILGFFSAVSKGTG